MASSPQSLPSRERHHEVTSDHFDAEHPVKLRGDAERGAVDELELVRGVSERG
jgi:hypothetical protein